MPVSISAEWQQLLLYAAGAALLLIVLFNLPYVGRFFRFLFSFAILAFFLFVLFQQAPYDPNLSRVVTKLGLDDQQVVGEEVRIRMARDGHFWAQASVNGVERRMLIDSGATVTMLSRKTADLANVDLETNVLPVIVQTAAGAVQARTSTIDRLQLGSIEARNLKIVVSAALGEVDVIGMNFLSQLGSWRVEDRTLFLVPRNGDGAE
ncbi:TIGR02281 family clan AA aspartic protease [Iodidimonas sp. SYSU 1G8]|uniref:retropepsin-like aspartic protease family protein n=1 Tax=Iodidimonas sp. SYSU 1G8 TaxID=3133967 RepID=UPI0031FEFFD1